MDQSEIKRRTPVWSTLSDLFLDTEMQAYNHRHIASVITEAGYTPDDAETILRTEVAPVFHMNLRSVAGEWVGWSEEEVVAMVVKRLDNPVWWQKIGWLRKIILNRHMVLVAGDWHEIKKISVDDADIAAAGKVLADIASGSDELVPSEIVDQLLNGANPVRVWRNHRGMTARELARKTELSAAYISEIETGKKDGSIASMKKIATVLGVDLDDLV